MGKNQGKAQEAQSELPGAAEIGEIGEGQSLESTAGQDSVEGQAGEVDRVNEDWVEVKVLYQFEMGSPGDCVKVPAGDLPVLKELGLVDDNAAEVAAAKAN